MADWKVVRNDPDYPEPLDPEIVPLCEALNAAGFVTTSSCSGHGRDWPYVWFEHSTDARIEDLARFVLGTEGEYYRSHFTVWQKEIRPNGYAWSLEIHLNNVYGDTPSSDFLEQAALALGFVTEAVHCWMRQGGLRG